jgi:hypothetical protein
MKAKLPSGARLYPTKGNMYPSVTTILTSTESHAAQKRLENWGNKWKENPENKGKTEPKDRGSLIDNVLSSYFTRSPEQRVLPTSWGLPEDVKPFMESILKPIKATGCSPLAQIGNVIWSQGLMDDVGIPREQRQFYTPNIKIAREQEFISSAKYGYAGCPDFIGDYTDAKGNTKLSLISLKTSDKKYSKESPDWIAFGEAQRKAKEMGEVFTPPADWSIKYGANQKFKRAAMQEAAYDIPLQESLGIYVAQWVVMVVTVQGVQLLSISGMEKDWHTRNWLKKVAKFYELFPEMKVA